MHDPSRAHGRRLGEGIHSPCDNEAEERERQRRLYEHRVLGAVGERHHIGRANPDLALTGRAPVVRGANLSG